MRLTKVEKIQVMREMLDELKPFIEESGLKINYLVLPPEVSQLPAEMITAGYKWLDEIHSLNLSNLQYIDGLLKPEIWKRYKLWGGYEDHREMLMRTAALKKLRKEICTREGKADLFIKGHRDAAIKKATKK